MKQDIIQQDPRHLSFNHSHLTTGCAPCSDPSVQYILPITDIFHAFHGSQDVANLRWNKQCALTQTNTNCNEAACGSG